MDFDFARDIVLENDRALIRPMTDADAQNLLPVVMDNEKLVQFSPIRIHSPELLAKFIRNGLRDRERKDRYAFTVFDKHTGLFAGSTSFGNISNHDKRIEIGWTWIGQGFQKTGLNRNIKYLMMSYLFEALEFERLEFRTDERNTVSRNAIEKIGGKQEGILRSHMRMPDGFRRSTVYYSILLNEWPEVKAGVFSKMLEKES